MATIPHTLEDLEKGTAPHDPIDVGSNGPSMSKDVKNEATAIGSSEEPASPPTFSDRFHSYTQQFEKQLVLYNLEARGIQRVEDHERHSTSSLGYIQIILFWISINLAANNITLGMLASSVFQLSFLDSAMCAVFGAIVGSLPVAYIATFGPISGNRTMIFARYAMGWWPSKLIVILNLIVSLGYSLIDCVVAGQILSAVSPHGSLPVVVGIIIVAVITWVITTFGYEVFHYYERYAWFPQVMVYCILAGVAGPHFDTSTPSQGDPTTIIGNRISWFSLALSAAITYGGGAADYFVYYPQTTPRWKVFSMSMIGLTFSFSFALLVGIGLGSGVATNSSWGAASDVSQGALIVAGFAPLGDFGKFCGVVVALGLIGNLVAPTYSSGVDFQILGRYAEKIPRVIWNTIGVIIYTVCALAGRNSLSDIFTNFLALMGYWVAIWVAILLEENFIFRRNRGYNWESWNDPSKLPIGIAALVAFLIGWAGAIICMAQVWYIGPIAARVGDYGADIGNYVGFSWAGLVYPALRWYELKKTGR